METLENLLAQLVDGEDERAEAAVDAIASHGAAAVGRLEDILAAYQGSEGKNVDARWWALRALAAIQGEKVAPILIRALLDADASVRQCAALGLRSHPDQEAVPALIGMLQDRDALCRTLAADALVALGGQSVQPLIEVLESGPQKARLEAVRALAAIGDKRAIPVLFSVFDEGSAILEYWASEGLERMGVGMNFFKPGV